MAVIDPNSPVIGESCSTFWSDQLTNKKILLYNVQLAILQLETGKIQSYQLDTGQTSQRVTRQNISELYKAETDLLSDIRDLELKLGLCDKGTIQVRPNW